jgi:hypothetical protein
VADVLEEPRLDRIQFGQRLGPRQLHLIAARTFGEPPRRHIERGQRL